MVHFDSDPVVSLISLAVVTCGEQAKLSSLAISIWEKEVSIH